MTDPDAGGTGEGEGLGAEQLSSIANLLRIGIGISALLLLTGIGLALQQAIPFDPSANLPLANEAWFRWPVLTGRLGEGNGVAVITIGLLALVATPGARVLLGAYYFARNRDRAMAMIAGVLLGLLLLGAFLLGPLLD